MIGWTIVSNINMTCWKMEPTTLVRWRCSTTQAMGSMLEQPIFDQTHGTKPPCSMKALTFKDARGVEYVVKFTFIGGLK